MIDEAIDARPTIGPLPLGRIFHYRPSTVAGESIRLTFTPDGTSRFPITREWTNYAASGPAWLVESDWRRKTVRDLMRAGF
jgi:hypothetical protein